LIVDSKNALQIHEKLKGENELDCTRVALSTMLGGICCFYGDTKIAVHTALLSLTQIL
jgi:hypothetical protein